MNEANATHAGEVLPARGSAQIPEARPQIAATSRAQIDEALATLREHAGEWAGLDIQERIQLLEELTGTTLAAAERWVAAACDAKGIERGTPAEGEEWFGGPFAVIRNLMLLRRSLQDIQTHGAPRLPGPTTTRAGGTVVAPVFPTDTWDKVLFRGFEAEVWMDPSVTPSTLEETMAGFYRHEPHPGAVSLVLGAGNVSSIGAMDALYKLFVCGEVVLLKVNPVNEYIGGCIDESFRELVRRGFLRIVYGGAEEGAYCCAHLRVDDIHVTGSDKTHDAIVYGTGPEGEERRRRREPQNEKPITSELGNVSPILVVPGPWTQGDLDYQGVNLVSSLVHNAGFNCNATRVIVTHAGWRQRPALLDAIKRAFTVAPPRRPYYPGAEARYRAFVDAHPEAFEFGPRGPGRVPWTFISDLDPEKRDDICFRTEAWAGVASEVPLEAEDPVAFLEKAVAFMNDVTWGQLSCSILVHPRTLKDARFARAMDDALAALRYGTIAINHWAGVAYGMVSPPWGAYPGNPSHDIGSGRGVVHNTYLFDRPLKSIVRGPFRAAPKPAWFFTNTQAHELGRRMTRFAADPSWDQLPGLVVSALRG